MGLAIFDLCPVVLFGITCILIGRTFGSILFVTGAILSLAGGLCKVLWKILLAAAKKDVHFLNRPLFIVLMPAGFLLMLLSIILAAGRISWGSLARGILSMPSLIFFLLGILGLAAMTVFFKKHDKTDVRNNWVEQTTNTFAQTMILLGVVFMI